MSVKSKEFSLFTSNHIRQSFHLDFYFELTPRSETIARYKVCHQLISCHLGEDIVCSVIVAVVDIVRRVHLSTLAPLVTGLK